MSDRVFFLNLKIYYFIQILSQIMQIIKDLSSIAIALFVYKIYNFIKVLITFFFNYISISMYHLTIIMCYLLKKLLKIMSNKVIEINFIT